MIPCGFAYVTNVLSSETALFYYRIITKRMAVALRGEG